MGFRINTNIAAMNSHMNSVNNNRALDKSLAALSTGLRINKAADDASGMAIANQLKSQASGLGQAIRNANDGINVAQTADGALEEYTNIINTVRTKSIQAASDGQNANSRKAIQADIDKLLQEANNISKTTSFNGQNLLDGSFQNKEFHIGAYSEETVGINIANTKTNAIGVHVDQTGPAAVTNAALTGALTIKTDALTAAVKVGASAADLGEAGDTVSIAHSADSAWAKAIAINAVSDKTEVTAIAKTDHTAVSAAKVGTISAGSLKINDIDIGKVDVSAGDADSALMNAINAVSNKTGVVASHDGGKIVLTAKDGSDIKVSAADANVTSVSGLKSQLNTGKITLVSDHTVQLNSQATKLGFAASANLSKASALSKIDVTTREGAEKAIRTTDSALKQIDKIRSDIGSTQNQLESTVRNISVTQVNVTSAESTIRDVDFAAESANLQKRNILAKSGVYAMSQANAAQQNVMRLLQ